ncbi:MogA/MoaB family molybdenum cofactor biosynthesis protein [Cryobacterium arcticum]|uniref:Molybdenum cofactor biosynthesis protein n=1 Tax=Cryobacterium arcticum TaxID=670052 RepID=A0A317ZQM3_9MICO|nr:MogA/MoaB family molybdenum cofactor biosynthesis protein [Cryobacterium arcticum]PXA67363.1 molybdenum cofactor biosynthesis protein [Cryobacterium arcticum]
MTPAGKAAAPPERPVGRGRGRTAQVIVASTRAAQGVYRDRTGPVIDAWLGERGWIVLDRAVVADGVPVGDALAAAIEAGLDLVITTGGTGVSPTDQTPEQTLPQLDRELPGIMEELRRRGTASTPLAVLSRGHAGIARGRTVVINLPGSTGGVRDGLGVLAEVLDHLLDQVHGVDHAAPSASARQTNTTASAVKETPHDH